MPAVYPGAWLLVLRTNACAAANPGSPGARQGQSSAPGPWAVGCWAATNINVADSATSCSRSRNPAGVMPGPVNRGRAPTR